MDAREFAEWQAFYNVEPFGDDWLQAGTMAAAVLAPWSKRNVKPGQFIPKIVERKSPEQMERELTMFARMHNNGRHRQN